MKNTNSQDENTDQSGVRSKFGSFCKVVDWWVRPWYSDFFHGLAALAIMATGLFVGVVCHTGSPKYLEVLGAGIILIGTIITNVGASFGKKQFGATLQIRNVLARRSQAPDQVTPKDVQDIEAALAGALEAFLYASGSAKLGLAFIFVGTVSVLVSQTPFWHAATPR